MELKVTWHQFAKRNSSNIVFIVHADSPYHTLYTQRIECEWEMESDLKEISVIKKPKGDDGNKMKYCWKTIQFNDFD